MMRPPAVLTISSQVAAGPVGNSAIVPALLSLGVTPVAVPTIVLSNHPGHGRPEGLAVPAATLQAMLEQLLTLGLIAGCRMVLTGYFAQAEQVDAVADFIIRLREREPDLYLLCDPVIGDEDELYVKPDIAVAIRNRLVPLANCLIPNSFEAGWLTGKVIRDLASAEAAARHWIGKDVIITSIPDGAQRLATAFFGAGSNEVVTRPRLAKVPHGTGDLLAGLIAGHIAMGQSIETCLAPAVAQVEHAIAASGDGEVLELAQGLKR